MKDNFIVLSCFLEINSTWQTNIYLLLHLMQIDAEYRSNPGIEQLNSHTQEVTFLPRPNNPVLPDELPANASEGTARNHATITSVDQDL
jgi:hypothetical protein